MVDDRSENPHVLSAATAVPPHRIEQRKIKELASRLFGGKVRDLDRLLLVFDNGQIENRLFELGLNTNLKRIPVWGLGCAGGAAGVARAADYAPARTQTSWCWWSRWSCAALRSRSATCPRATWWRLSLFADGAAVLIGQAPERG